MEDFEPIPKVSKKKQLWLRKQAIELQIKKIKSEIWFIENIKRWTKYKLQQSVAQSHYIIDFVYYELAIEVDGSFHDSPEQQLKDRKKDRDLTNLGYTVIRVKAHDQDSFWNCIKLMEKYDKIKSSTKQLKSSKLVKRVEHAENHGYCKYNKPKGILGLKPCQSCRTRASEYNTKQGRLCKNCFKDYQRKLARKRK